MPPAIIAAIIAGGAAVGTGIGKGIANKKARKEARRVSELNRSRLLEDRFYNEPKQQMARFKDANLNPNLIYGQGQSGAGTATGGESTEQTQEFSPLDVTAAAGPAISSIANVSQQQAGIENIHADTESKKATTLSQIQKNLEQIAKWKQEGKYIANIAEAKSLEATNRVLMGNLNLEATNLAHSQNIREESSGRTKKAAKQAIENGRLQIQQLNDKHALSEYERAINAIKKKGVKITLEMIKEIIKYIKR